MDRFSRSILQRCHSPDHSAKLRSKCHQQNVSKVLVLLVMYHLQMIIDYFLLGST